MEVNAALIDQLSHLARLTIKPEEKEQLQQDMQQMIGFIEKLQELDTTGIEPDFAIVKYKKLVSREFAISTEHKHWCVQVDLCASFEFPAQANHDFF